MPCVLPGMISASSLNACTSNWPLRVVQRRCRRCLLGGIRRPQILQHTDLDLVVGYLPCAVTGPSSSSDNSGKIMRGITTFPLCAPDMKRIRVYSVIIAEHAPHDQNR